VAGFFYNLGKMVGPKVRQAQWVVSSLTGTEAQAIQAEHDVGRDLAQSMEVERNPDVERWLEEIGGRLAACVAQRQRKFCFRLARSIDINAFALPGGFVFVTGPLLELCRWDVQETAFVLGHEMGHVLCKHAINRLMASSVLSTALTRFTPGRGLLGAPVAGLATSLLNQGYSRDQELEADRAGVQLAGAAGFDPAAALRLLERLGRSAADAGLLGSYFSSHPPTEIRIRSLEQGGRGC
jgi:predicted Zn-dependent protease